MDERGKPWYRRFPEALAEAAELRGRYHKRCEQLGAAPNTVAEGFRRDSLARAVHESNWQEGVELEFGRTRELADIAMSDLRFPDGSRMDLEGIVENHRQQILAAKRAGATVEEVATTNLARAHVVLSWIRDELAERQTASLASALKKLSESLQGRPGIGKTLLSHAAEGYELVEELLKERTPVGRPLTGGIATEGELLRAMLASDHESLVRPMDAKYLHALHRITMMGVVRTSDLGRWRRSAVHVGNPDIDFPTPAAVGPLMDEFCRDFPTILPGVTKYDAIVKAAETSYRFVRIHPYIDGNGRMSRLLMNLVLMTDHPFCVSLAPRAKERHRYREAIRRADRGKLEPLVTLIALSVSEQYRRVLSALVDPVL